MLRRINGALPGLVAGILVYGVVVQLVGVWFVSDKLSYSIGLWFGIAVAVGLAINIATVIFDAVTMDTGDKNANRRIIAKSVLRYVVVVILFFILGYFKLGNLFTALLGVLGLKVSAYLQPSLSKALSRLRRTIVKEKKKEVSV
jgi:uncharacterized membrane protein YiaA